MPTEDYHIKTGYHNMDIPAIHHFLSYESYWAKDIPLELVEKSLQHSYCVGVFKEDKQVGFARLVTDYSTFAYLSDVYIEKVHRGKGLSKKLMAFIMNQEEVKVLRRISLATLDAHQLYKQFGFQSPENPETLMEIKKTNPYAKN